MTATRCDSDVTRTRSRRLTPSPPPPPTHTHQVRGLYKGLGTNFLRVIPTTAITFVVYEAVAKRLGART